MGLPRHCEQPIVPFDLRLALLFNLQNADDAAGQNHAGKRRGVVDDHDIEGVAIVGPGGGDEAPIMRIGQPDEKRLFQRERFEFWIKSYLRATSPRRFNDHMYVASLGEGRQIDKVRHVRLLWSSPVLFEER